MLPESSESQRSQHPRAPTLVRNVPIVVNEGGESHSSGVVSLRCAVSGGAHVGNASRVTEIRLTCDVDPW